MYFDRVSDPGAQAGYSQAADRLLHLIWDSPQGRELLRKQELMRRELLTREDARQMLFEVELLKVK